MANKKWKDAIVVLDNASAATSRITAYVNSASIRAAINLLDQTPLGATAPSSIPGLVNGTVPINGWVNSTTDALFGPLVEGTSITKTFGLNNGVTWFTGEVWPEDVEFSGSAGELQTFSANLRFEGAINHTSAAPA